MTNLSRHHPSTDPGLAREINPGRGEHIVIRVPEHAQLTSPVLVAGRFGLSPAIAAILPQHLHRSLAICAVFKHGLVHRASCPFADVVLFPEDVADRDGLLVGFFEVDLRTFARFEYPGQWWITASIGPIAGTPTPLAIER